MLLLTVAAAATVKESQPETEVRPGAIGVVRSDGILFPLGHVQDGVWTPLSNQNSDVGGPQLTDAARKLSRTGWTAFPLSGRTPFPITIRGITKVDSHCVEMEGFLTDVPTRPFPAHTWPRPKIAIAVWGAGTVALGERVRMPYDAAARRAAAVIVALTQSIEVERMQATANSPLARYTAAERGRVPVHVTTLMRRSFSERTPYYFEERKRYAIGFDVFVSGWLVQSQDDMELTHTSATVTDLDYKGVETARVLGVVELADRAVWVLEAHGYESESYALMEFPPFDTARRPIRVAAGGC